MDQRKEEEDETEDYEFVDCEEDLPGEIPDRIYQDNPDEIEESLNVEHMRDVSFAMIIQ